VAADAAGASYQAADGALLQLAAVILEPLSSEGGFLSSCCCCGGFDDSDLLLYTSLVEATPPKLAAWCALGDEEAAALLDLFGLSRSEQRSVQSHLEQTSLSCPVRQDRGGSCGSCPEPCCRRSGELLRRFVEAGRPRRAEYGRAAQLYRQLTEAATIRGGSRGDDGSRSLRDDGIDDDDAAAVCDRLAVAVALEFCCDPDPIDQPVEHRRIDPVERYRHYRDAYLKGNELDPAFARLTSWEMRMAVNSDAPDAELQWGRDCLRNYRPDIAAMDDPQWRYCFIVRQDVDYKDPDWFKPERSYDQILSGGGECGPRAWYGRFICKAFGIPTWGVRQPGHAAMARWTTDGEWKTCLGAGFDVSDWNGRCGDDFELEARARIRLKSDAAYLCRVIRLELLAQFYGESDKNLRSTGEPDASNPWFTLSMLQRRILAPSASAADRVPDPGWTADCEGTAPGRLEDALVLSDSQSISYRADGSIVIPASSGTIDPTDSSKVVVMKSFSGGSQLFLGKDGEIEYSLDRGKKAPASYLVSLQVCTVHRIQEPLRLIVSPDEEDIPATVVSLPLPYTVGMWQETEPVEVELGTSTRITLKRQEPKFGAAVKYITLVPAIPSDTA
jgi:hypothetical protein